MRLSIGRHATMVLLLAGVGVTTILLWEVLRPRGEARPAAGQPSGGRAIYAAHCAVCHGPTGKGDGPGASVVRQPIRDFSDAAAMREVSDGFLFEITKKGSSQFGRSNAMPAWGMKLSDEQIRAVIAHIRSLASPNPSASSGGKDAP
jgi:mono/diheme cytochrome c family protein